MAKKGESTSSETRRKMSQARLGWNPSMTTRERMSNARKQRNAEETLPERQCDECSVTYQPGSWSSKFCSEHTQAGRHTTLRAIRDKATCCAICAKADVKLVVDHCHGCGLIRGVLCVPCNTGIGAFQDSHVLLQRASLYLDMSELLSEVQTHPFHKEQQGSCVHRQPEHDIPQFTDSFGSTETEAS